MKRTLRPLPPPPPPPSLLERTVIAEFANAGVFEKLLRVNPGVVVVMMSTPGCVHCRTIEPIVHAFFASLPQQAVCCDLSAATSPDLYGVLKRKRMVVAFPTLLLYVRGNESLIPDDSVMGADPHALELFFDRVKIMAAAAAKR